MVIVSNTIPGIATRATRSSNVPPNPIGQPTTQQQPNPFLSTIPTGPELKKTPLAIVPISFALQKAPPLPTVPTSFGIPKTSLPTVPTGSGVPKTSLPTVPTGSGIPKTSLPTVPTGSGVPKSLLPTVPDGSGVPSTTLPPCNAAIQPRPCPQSVASVASSRPADADTPYRNTDMADQPPAAKIGAQYQPPDVAPPLPSCAPHNSVADSQVQNSMSSSLISSDITFCDPDIPLNSSETPIQNCEVPLNNSDIIFNDPKLLVNNSEIVLSSSSPGNNSNFLANSTNISFKISDIPLPNSEPPHKANIFPLDNRSKKKFKEFSKLISSQQACHTNVAKGTNSGSLSNLNISSLQRTVGPCERTMSATKFSEKLILSNIIQRGSQSTPSYKRTHIRQLEFKTPDKTSVPRSSRQSKRGQRSLFDSPSPDKSLKERNASRNTKRPLGMIQEESNSNDSALETRLSVQKKSKTEEIVSDLNVAKSVHISDDLETNLISPADVPNTSVGTSDDFFATPFTMLEFDQIDVPRPLDDLNTPVVPAAPPSPPDLNTPLIKQKVPTASDPVTPHGKCKEVSTSDNAIDDSAPVEMSEKVVELSPVHIKPRTLSSSQAGSDDEWIDEENVELLLENNIIITDNPVQQITPDAISPRKVGNLSPRSMGIVIEQQINDFSQDAYSNVQTIEPDSLLPSDRVQNEHQVMDSENFSSRNDPSEIVQSPEVLQTTSNSDENVELSHIALTNCIIRRSNKLKCPRKVSSDTSSDNDGWNNGLKFSPIKSSDLGSSAEKQSIFPIKGSTKDDDQCYKIHKDSDKETNSPTKHKKHTSPMADRVIFRDFLQENKNTSRSASKRKRKTLSPVQKKKYRRKKPGRTELFDDSESEINEEKNMEAVQAQNKSSSRSASKRKLKTVSPMQKKKYRFSPKKPGSTLKKSARIELFDDSESEINEDTQNNVVTVEVHSNMEVLSDNIELLDSEPEVVESVHENNTPNIEDSIYNKNSQKDQFSNNKTDDCGKKLPKLKKGNLKPIPDTRVTRSLAKKLSTDQASDGNNIKGVVEDRSEEVIEAIFEVGNRDVNTDSTEVMDSLENKSLLETNVITLTSSDVRDGVSKSKIRPTKSPVASPLKSRNDKSPPERESELIIKNVQCDPRLKSKEFPCPEPSSSVKSLFSSKSGLFSPRIYQPSPAKVLQKWATSLGVNCPQWASPKSGSAVQTPEHASLHKSPGVTGGLLANYD